MNRDPHNYISWDNARRNARLGAQWAIYLTYNSTSKNSHKFYEVLGKGFMVLRVRNGRIGTAGQTQQPRNWSYVLDKVPNKMGKGYQEHISDRTPSAAPFPYSEIRHLLCEDDAWYATNDTGHRLFDLPPETAADILNKNKFATRRTQDSHHHFEIQAPVLL